MMSLVSIVSAIFTFINSTVKTVTFIWRSHFRTKVTPIDEMRAYTEIRILEEYQWYHCLIPILGHFSSVFGASWLLVLATTERYLDCNSI